MQKKNTCGDTNVFPLFTLILSLCFLFIFTVTVTLLGGKESSAARDGSTVTLIKYVYVTPPCEDEGALDVGKDDMDEERFLVKEYLGVIGIFSVPDNTLVYSVEINVKTLPEADRRLLREGFEVIGINGVYSVIEDYTG